MKFIFFLLLMTSSFKVFSNGIITEIRDHQEVFIDVLDTTTLKENEKVLIVSRGTNKAIAFGVISKIDKRSIPASGLVTIVEIIENSLVMVKDIVYPMNYKVMEDKKVPGFASLTLHGDDHIPARFKELAYFGVFTSEGHTLDAKEFLVSPFQVQYGIVNDFGVKMVNALWFDGYANAGIKYRVMRNKYAKITVNTLGAYKVQSQDYIWQVGGVVTLPSNAKFQSHLMANFTFDPQFDDAKATRDLGLFQDSDIRSITEYVTDKWNRVLYGPVYNVEQQTFGGTVSHMWIFDTFHMSLGIATKDFTDLTFGTNGYYYVYDLFWRF